jgi:hypothetical protein
MIRRLNPNCDRLFQKPRSTPKSGVYYNNIPVGHNQLGQFMQNISKAAGISTIYTNHSCRATTVSVLDAAQIPSRHIMSVTGHKAKSSLKTYSGRTNEKTKRIMSNKISEKIREKKPLQENFQSQNEIMQPAGFSLIPLTDSQEKCLIDDLSDMDGVDDILRSIDFQTKCYMYSELCSC